VEQKAIYKIQLFILIK